VRHVFIKRIDLKKGTEALVTRHDHALTRMRVVIACAVAIVLTAAVPAVATVIDVAPNGFTVQVSAHIAAAPGKVYAALIKPALWWDSAHTFSGDARNLILNAKPGGCWCEKLADGGSAVHLTVVYVDPGKVLRLRGALGPFQAYGVEGALTWTLKASGGGTDVSVTYALGGYYKDGFEPWSKGADSVFSDQVERLNRLVETGSPEKR
jgi:uncharacterized protein YndB with AHSA1/START domain